MAVELFAQKALQAASRWYKRSMAVELNKMGLQYEDLLISETPEMKEALELADPDIVKGRYRRLKRASDLTYKGKTLQDYAPEKVPADPFKFELRQDLEKIKARNQEMQLLDLHKK